MRARRIRLSTRTACEGQTAPSFRVCPAAVSLAARRAPPARRAATDPPLPPAPARPTDNDDDGESAAGGRIAHLLQILDVFDVLVVVTRYFGGVHLGPDRFKHIGQAARDALETGGFLGVDGGRPAAGAGGGKKRGR